ncbi:MAG: family transporter [Acidimicrobiales bacterium]|nr:family transporter [Acidimicrobiales bacterium]
MTTGAAATVPSAPAAGRPLVERLPAWAVAAMAATSGALLTLQARINGRLSGELDGGHAHTIGHSALAALISFGSGLVVAAVVVAARRASRQGFARLHAVPWLLRIGGFGGAVLVTSQAATVPVLGLSLFTVTLVASQTAGGLGVDRLGFGPSGRHAVTAPRVGGAALAVAAVAVAARGRGSGSFSVGALALVVLAGVLVSAQQALNGRVHGTVRDPMVASLVNFAAGTAALVGAVAACAALGQLRTVHLPGTWWLYLGGSCGVIFIAINASVVQRLGVLGLVLGAVCGQVVASLALDALWPAAGASVRAATVVGTLLTLVAVAVVTRSGRDSSGDASPG